MERLNVNLLHKFLGRINKDGTAARITALKCPWILLPVLVVPIHYRDNEVSSEDERKEDNMCQQKRGMQLLQKCLKFIEKQHPNLSKEELRDVMKNIYEEKYSGSNKLVLYYQHLMRCPESSQGAGVREMHLTKRLKVDQKLLKFCKESDQGRRSKHVTEKKESDEKMENRHRTPPENKGL